MNVLFDNVDMNSSSGPNSFAKKLSDQLKYHGHTVVTQGFFKPDVQLSFINIVNKQGKIPTILRLDGIYFNTRQDWNGLNTPIESAFKSADAVVYQSHFNKALIEKYFGNAKMSEVINNGVSLKAINSISPLHNTALDQFSEVWCCASSWRPHKRLSENIRYFLESAPSDSCLVVAGNNPDYVISHPRVFYVGNLPWEQCIALYKRSSTFIHLAFLDHCPNVVVDARACGCNIVVASSGGTKEIVPMHAIIIDDLDWDFSPIDLYDPPKLDFSRFKRNQSKVSVDIEYVASQYLNMFNDVIEEK